MLGWLRPQNESPLESVLLNWSPKVPFRVRDLLDGGVLCLGRTGSGKTSSSCKALAKAIVAHPMSCGLICVPKPEDLAMWNAIFNAAGRSHDLLVFDAEGGPLRMNFLAEAAKLGGSSREITRFITVIAEALSSSEGSGQGEMGDFWERERERMILNAVEVIRQATGEVTAPLLHSFISTSATSPSQLKEPEFRESQHSRLLERACKAPKTPIEKHDLQLAADYWLGEVPGMASRTRSSIVTNVLGLLHVFNMGLVRELISTTTNVTPDSMLQDGKWVLVNVPPARYGDMGTLINAGWKYLAQRAVLKRHAGQGDTFHVIWCDEAQQFVGEFDSQYLAQCRSHRGCMVYLTQSLHSIQSALGETNSDHKAQSLLANFGTRIIHALGDLQYTHWASGLLGNRLETFVGASTQPAGDLVDQLVGANGFSGNFSTHYEPILQPNVFLNGLRTGGPRNGYVCDCIVMRSGEPFAHGENWLHAAFRQR